MIEDRLRYLGSSEVITDKLTQITEAFVTFYGEDKRSEIEERFKNTLIIRFMSVKSLRQNVRLFKESPLKELYGISEEENLGFNIEDYPNSYNTFKNEVTLPLYSLLTDEEIDYVIEKFIETYNEMM